MKLIMYVKEEEFFKILKAEKQDKFKLAYKFAFGSGLRISEIVGYKRKNAGEIKPLTREQIDLQAKTIKVIGGKGMKDRIVPLFPGFKESDLKLLPLDIKRSTLQIHFTTLCKKVLGTSKNFHQLRHGFAVASVKKKVQLPFLQHALGHSRLDTTGIYTQAAPEDMLEAYRKAGWE